MEFTEFKFIDSIKSKFSNLNQSESIGIGDDCSVIPFSKTHYQLTTTDLLVENIHFILNKSTGFQLGHKSLMVNLSDIAAMGGNPRQAYLSLAVPTTIKDKFLHDFIDGFRAGCQEYNISLMGGDTTSSENRLTISVTVQGLVEKDKIKLRSTANRNDLICVTSQLGDSALGLKVILDNFETSNNDYFLDKHNSPKAQINEGQFLANFEGVTSMMDISDGIASDIKHICNSSELGAEIHLEKIPLSKEFLNTCKLQNQDLFEKAISGGEDYSLLLTINEKEYSTIQELFYRQFKTQLFVVGHMTDSGEVSFLKNSIAINNSPEGFDHFRKSNTCKPLNYKRVLTIAGSDSGGGAGIQADIKTITELGGYPTTAITCVTAQNTLGVQKIQTLPEDIIKQQILSVLDDIGTDTIKIGLLGNEKIIQVIFSVLNTAKKYKVVLDPVMVATSGDLLLDDNSIKTMTEKLFPLTYLLTPNLHEAEALTKTKINSEAKIKEACELIHKMGASNVLIKGGHGDGPLSSDTLYMGSIDKLHTFSSKRVTTNNTHGTGCTLSAAIATFLAKGYSLKTSVEHSKSFIQNAIIEGSKYQLGQGNGPLKLNNLTKG